VRSLLESHVSRVRGNEQAIRLKAVIVVECNAATRELAEGQTKFVRGKCAG
jgi:hypothetical protein